MGEPDPRTAALEDTRRHLKRHLGPYRHHLKQLLEHIDHMEQVDLDDLQAVLNVLDGKEPAGREEIINALRTIHTDKEECRLDMEREGLVEPESASARAPFLETLRHGFRSLRDG